MLNIQAHGFEFDPQDDLRRHPATIQEFCEKRSPKSSNQDFSVVHVNHRKIFHKHLKKPHCANKRHRLRRDETNGQSSLQCKLYITLHFVNLTVAFKSQSLFFVQTVALKTQSLCFTCKRSLLSPKVYTLKFTSLYSTHVKFTLL
jgi:hypothetical protein